MQDVVSFQIVTHPDQTLLSEIDRKRKAAQKLNDAPGSTGDYVEPAWVHEFIVDPTAFKYLHDVFKEGLRK